ncbi:MAG: DUF3604 domain-containing protein [Pseudomonadota bacterium]
MKSLHMLYLGALLTAVVACDQTATPSATDQGEVSTKVNAGPPSSASISPAPEQRRALFGDLHVHSSWSADGYIFGNTNDPDAAYRFARGEAVPLGRIDKTRQLEVPLDFAAVTDHAETLGYFNRCVVDEASAVYDAEMCSMLRALDLRLYFMGFRNLSANPPVHVTEICESNESCREAAKPLWKQLQTIADTHNVPGEFTTFKAYEYTGNLRAGGMLHRNVIFNGNSVPDEAMSAFDLQTTRELWNWLDESCQEDCDVITIPHNSNLAWGKTFALTNSDGSEWTEEDYQRRQRMDRLAEIFQAKGSSECFTGIGTNDEFCNFETLLKPCTAEQELGCMQQSSFVRNGLKTGLKLEATLGFNPFQYGIIASTDTHNGTPGDTSESNYGGHQAGETSIDHRLTGGHRKAEGRGAVNYNPGGLVGAWADENSRDSLFAAFKRRETFGTSGSRMSIRLFAGFNYAGNLVDQPDAVTRAYRDGFPMGSTLTVGDTDTPSLFAWASQDPNAAPLQRLQIIKGWIDDSGETQERTFDVACAGNASPDQETHRCPASTAGVNADCEATGDPGATQLSALWQDPQFRPGQRSFYYARALENPSCRWSAYDLMKSNNTIEPSSPVPRVIQERAWSSPVWLTPAGD